MRSCLPAPSHRSPRPTGLMTRAPMTWAITTLALAVLVAPTALAQQPQEAAAQAATIGVFFWHDSPNDRATFAGIQRGLAAAKVAVRFVERHAEADEAKAIRQLAELRAEPCQLVLALGTRATQLAQQHLVDVPIVFAAVTNPVLSLIHI